MSYSGLIWLTTALVEGEKTVQGLIARDDPHRALGQARWLYECGHPDGERLVQDAERAIRGVSGQRVKAGVLTPTCPDYTSDAA